MVGIFSMLKKYYKSLFLYILVGGVCALIDWTIFYLLNYSLMYNYILAAAAAFVIASTVNYFLSKKVFISKRENKGRELGYIYLASLLALGADVLAMVFFIEIMLLTPLLSKVLGTGVGFFINYGMRQFFIFSREAKYE